MTDTNFQIYLHSTDAIQRTQSSWTFDLTHMQAMSRPGTRTLMHVTNVMFPYSFYAINASNNRFFTSRHDFLIPPGNYTVDELLKTINDALGIEALTMDYIRGRVKVTFALETSLNMADDAIWKILGFYRPQDTITVICPAFVTVEAKYMVNMTPISCVNMHCNEIRTHHISTDQQSTVLCRIPVTGFRGCVMNFSPSIHDPKTTVMELQDHWSLVTVYFSDEDRNILDLNGIEWSATLSIEFVYDPKRARSEFEALRLEYLYRPGPRKYNLQQLIYKNSNYARREDTATDGSTGGEGGRGDGPGGQE